MYYLEKIHNYSDDLYEYCTGLYTLPDETNFTAKLVLPLPFLVGLIVMNRTIINTKGSVYYVSSDKNSNIYILNMVLGGDIILNVDGQYKNKLNVQSAGAGTITCIIFHDGIKHKDSHLHPYFEI